MLQTKKGGTTMRKRILLTMGLILALFGTGLEGGVTAQAQSKKPPAEAQLPNIVIHQTLKQHDFVLFRCTEQLECQALSGEVLNDSLTFQVDPRCSGPTCATRQIPTDQIVLLDLQGGSGEILLETGERIAGKLVEGIRVRLAGLEIELQLPAEQLGLVAFQGQGERLDLAGFRRLLDGVRRLPTRQDVLIFQNDGVFAGLILTQTFEVATSSGIQRLPKRKIREILFGDPDLIRLKSGDEISGEIHTTEVQFQLTRLITVSKATLSRILFADAERVFSPKGKGSGPSFCGSESCQDQ